MKTLILILFAVLSAPLASATALILTPPDILGKPGDVIGWGFSLFNDGAGYLTPTGVDFTPTNGIYVGFLPVSPSDIWLLQSFLVVGPGQTLTQAFDAAAHQGIGPFTINDFQPLGDISAGNLRITYDYYATDPNGDDFDVDNPGHQYGLTVSAPASAGAAVPEPSSLLLLGLGTVALGFRRRP